MLNVSWTQLATNKRNMISELVRCLFWVLYKQIQSYCSFIPNVLMTDSLYLVFHGHPVKILLYCSCLCCHLFESIYLYMTLICDGFSFIYISFYARNRVGTLLTGLTLPYFVGCKMHRSALLCRILVCICHWNSSDEILYRTLIVILLIIRWQSICVLLMIKNENKNP